MKKLNFKTFILAVLLLTITSYSAKSQSYTEYLSPYWDSYYKSKPSGIEDAFKASDFIRVLEEVEFIPNSQLLNKDFNSLKRFLLSLDYPSLKQLMITGDFYSRTKMHDDYYTLYKMTYRYITKSEWDKFCPYLIPIMELDKTVKLH